MPQDPSNKERLPRSVVNRASKITLGTPLCKKAILGDPGADSGSEGKSKGAENMARRKVKNGEKSPWGQCLARLVPNGRRRSDFSLVPENLCQSEVRTATTVWNLSGRILSPGALLAVLYFRLSLAPTICPWVSEDAKRLATPLISASNKEFHITGNKNKERGSYD